MIEWSRNDLTYTYIVTEFIYVQLVDSWIFTLATASCSTARRVAGPEPENEALLYVHCVLNQPSPSLQVASNPGFPFRILLEEAARQNPDLIPYVWEHAISDLL